MNTSRLSLVVMLLGLGAASLCKADDVTYYVDQTVGAGSVTGDIVTDGTIGSLGQSDIVDWNLLLYDGITTDDLVGPSDESTVTVYSAEYNSDGLSDLSASATQLFFDFSGASGANFGYVDFEGINDAGGSVCFQTTDICFGVEGSGGEEFAISFPFSPLEFTSLSDQEVIATTTAPSTPEPSTLVLLGAGLALVGFRKITVGRISK